MQGIITPVELGSVLNFRDAGGIPATEGRKIRSGMIYRSASPDGINKKDIIRLHELQIKTIVDLRAPHEADGKRKKIDNIDTVNLPLDFEKVTRERLIPLLKQKNAGKMIPEMILNLYNEILDASSDVFRNIVCLLLDTSRIPILIHCHAGKDRTGIVCALIQTALDAVPQSIVDNYLESNSSIVPHYRKALATRKILSLGFFPGDKILMAITVREEYILSVMDRIKNHYGGMQGYLNTEADAESVIKQLREKYVI